MTEYVSVSHHQTHQNIQHLLIVAAGVFVLLVQMILSGSLECATFSRLPGGIMAIPHPGVLEAYTSGKIPILDLEAGARLQMLPPVKLLDIWPHAIKYQIKALPLAVLMKASE